MLFEAMFNEHDSLHTIRNCQEKELLKADLACHAALTDGSPSANGRRSFLFQQSTQKQGLHFSECCTAASATK